MARWQPPQIVGPNERIGRRLFDEPILAGTEGQPSFSGIALTHFEQRDPEISLDRLGATGVDRKIVNNYLKPRAEAAGRTFAKPKRFDGWAAVSAKELINARKEPKLPIHSSPETDPEPNDNDYHAHVVRPEGVNSHLMALHLRYIFTTYGTVEKNQHPSLSWRDWLASRIAENWQRLLNLF